ncbi:hypothetical protein ACRALDRAFT_208857 [Sodiomyces alcalophilus JCM 7366]|uniref:uncharacterized protein n=1 Tax=Sodiomyces alcalophilus JCM 7366 TaxID=591952 RepID=UPI0039B606AC
MIRWALLFVSHEAAKQMSLCICAGLTGEDFALTRASSKTVNSLTRFTDGELNDGLYPISVLASLILATTSEIQGPFKLMYQYGLGCRQSATQSMTDMIPFQLDLHRCDAIDPETNYPNADIVRHFVLAPTKYEVHYMLPFR